MRRNAKENKSLTPFGSRPSILLSRWRTITSWKVFTASFQRTRHACCITVIAGCSLSRCGRSNCLRRWNGLNSDRTVSALRRACALAYFDSRLRRVELLRKRSSIDAEIFQAFVVLQDLFKLRADLRFSAGVLQKRPELLQTVQLSCAERNEIASERHVNAGSIGYQLRGRAMSRFGNRRRPLDGSVSPSRMCRIEIDIPIRT